MPEKMTDTSSGMRKMTMQMKTLEVEVVRVKITLACTECKQRNYNMTKEKKNEKKKDGLNSVLMQVAISIISIVFAFLVGGIIIAVMGENPFKAYSGAPGGRTF